MKKKNEQAVLPEEEGTPVKKEKKGRKIANIVINVILVIAILIAAFCTYISFVSSSENSVPSIFGRVFMSVQTDSMSPTLEPGDLIIDKKIDNVDELKVGDVITYWTIIQGERALNTHRIVSIDDTTGFSRIFVTKGDHNDTEDPLNVNANEVVGLYSTKDENGNDVGGTRLKGIGKVVEFLQTSTGFLLVVVLPVALFFLYHLIQFFRVLFEYQSVKNRLRFEQEREEAESEAKKEEEIEEIKKAEREKLEEELREKLKKELIESGVIPAAGAAEAAKAEVEEKAAEAVEEAGETAEAAVEESKNAAEEVAEEAKEEAAEAVEEAKEAVEETEKPED